MKHLKTHRNILPFNNPDLGTFHLYIKDDKDGAVANALTDKYQQLSIGFTDKPNSRVYTGYDHPILPSIEYINSLGMQWHIEYEELGTDLDTNNMVPFNEHVFTTSENVKTFIDTYYKAASTKHRKEWWDERTGESPMPIKTDSTINYTEKCPWCTRFTIKEIEYNLVNGIESYTPVYGCSYSILPCTFTPIPSEDK